MRDDHNEGRGLRDKEGVGLISYLTEIAKATFLKHVSRHGSATEMFVAIFPIPIVQVVIDKCSPAQRTCGTAATIGCFSHATPFKCCNVNWKPSEEVSVQVNWLFHEFFETESIATLYSLRSCLGFYRVET